MGIHAQYYWMAVTADKYELPLYVAESKGELAEHLGVSESTIATAEHRKKDGRKTGYRIAKARKG